MHVTRKSMQVLDQGDQDLSDARIVQFGKDNLWEIRNSLQRACRSIVNGNVATKNAYQVVQALQATIDINVKMNASLDATAAAKLLKNLADLGFTATGDQNVTLKGAALFVGVELEPISSPVADPAEPVASSPPQLKPDRISNGPTNDQRRSVELVR